MPPLTALEVIKLQGFKEGERDRAREGERERGRGGSRRGRARRGRKWRNEERRRASEEEERRMDGTAGGGKKEEPLSQSEETSCRLSSGYPKSSFFCPLTTPPLPARVYYTFPAVCGALQRLNRELLLIIESNIISLNSYCTRKVVFAVYKVKYFTLLFYTIKR